MLGTILKGVATKVGVTSKERLLGVVVELGREICDVNLVEETPPGVIEEYVEVLNACIDTPRLKYGVSWSKPFRSQCKRMVAAASPGVRNEFKRLTLHTGGRPVHFLVWSDYRQWLSGVDDKLTSLGLDLNNDIVTTRGLHDGLGGAFLPVDYYDWRWHEFRRAGLLGTSAVAHTCLLATTPDVELTHDLHESARALLRHAGLAIADADEIVKSALQVELRAFATLKPGVLRSTVVDPLVDRVLELAFEQSDAGATLAGRCVACAAGTELSSYQLYGFLDGTVNERICEKRTHGGSAVNIVLCSAASTWTWHSRRSCFLLATFDGDDGRQNVDHHLTEAGYFDALATHNRKLVKIETGQIVTLEWGWVLDTKADQLISGSLSSAIGNTPCVECVVTAVQLIGMRTKAVREPWRAAEAQLLIGAAAEVTSAHVAAKRAISRELAVYDVRSVTEHAVAALRRFSDGQRQHADTAFEAAALSVEALFAKGAKRKCPFQFRRYALGASTNGPFPLAGATLDGKTLLLPPVVGGFVMQPGPAGRASALSPRGRYPRNAHGSMATLEKEMSDLPCALRALARDYESGEVGEGGIALRARELASSTETSWRKAALALGVVGVAAAAHVHADKLKGKLAALAAAGGLPAVARGGAFESAIREAEQAVPRLLEIPHSTGMDPREVDYWLAARIFVVILTVTKDALTKATSEFGQVGRHLLRAVARVPAYPLVALDELHATLNCMGEKFSTCVLQLALIVGVFSSIKEETLTGRCKLQITDEAGKVHYQQMWGSEMQTWHTAYSCNSNKFMEPYRSVLRRMCTYASFIRSSFSEGDPAAFHGGDDPSSAAFRGDDDAPLGGGGGTPAETDLAAPEWHTRRREWPAMLVEEAVARFEWHANRLFPMYRSSTSARPEFTRHGPYGSVRFWRVLCSHSSRSSLPVPMRGCCRAPLALSLSTLDRLTIPSYVARAVPCFTGHATSRTSTCWTCSRPRGRSARKARKPARACTRRRGRCCLVERVIHHHHCTGFVFKIHSLLRLSLLSTCASWGVQMLAGRTAKSGGRNGPADRPRQAMRSAVREQVCRLAFTLIRNFDFAETIVRYVFIRRVPATRRSCPSRCTSTTRASPKRR